MKILGVRTAPQQIRYAIVEFNNGTATLLNATTENILRKPAHISQTAEHLKWVRDELARVIRQNPDLEKIALKTPEFQGSKTASSRHGEYLDAMVLIAAADAGIPVISKLYSQMGTKRADVLRHTEQRVGKTATGWNEQMADAVAVAWIAST